MTSSAHKLRAALDAYAAAKRRLALGNQLAVLLTAAFGGASILFLADYLLDLPERVRAALCVFYGLLLAYLALRTLLVLLRRQSATQLAIEIERASGLHFASTLVSSVELESGGEADRFGYSRELIAACTDAAHQLVRGLDPAGLADRAAFRQGVRRLLTVLAATALVGCWGRDGIAYVQSRYRASLGGEEPVGPVSFSVTPGDARLAEGSQLEIKLKLAGTDKFPRMIRKPALEPITLRWDGKAYVTTMPALTESFDYRFEAGPFHSRVFHVAVVRPPAVKRLVVHYHYPPYTGLHDETQEHGSNDIVAPVGSVVTLSGEASGALTAATAIFDGTRRVAARLSSARSFTTSFAVERNATYAVELVGPEGFPNRPTTYRITAVEDRVPLVYVLEPGKDLSVAVSEMTSFPLKVFVSDDYGVKSVKLHYSLAQRFEYTYLTSDFDEELALPKGDPKKLTLQYLWDLRKRVFQPGDSVTYYVEAADHMPGPKPHAGRSKSYSIRIPFLTDVAQETADEQDSQISSVEDMAHKQREIDDKLARAMKDIQKKEGSVDWKTKQQLEMLSKKQQELRKRAEEVASKMQSTMEKMSKNDLVDAGTLEKLKEVQDLFSQVADTRMKELMDKMRDLMTQTKMEQVDINKAQKQFDKQRYAKELDRILASLKKLKVQQEMQNAVKSLGEMAKKQDDLRKETERRLQQGKPVSDLAAKQKELENSVGKLLKQLEKLAADAGKPFPETAKSVQAALDEARKGKLPENVSEAAKSLASNRGDQALPKQNEALSQMQKMQASLSKSQASMKQKQTAVNLSKLLALTRYGIDISRLQETLVAKGSSAPEDMVAETREISRALAAVQARVHRGLESFERDFDALISDEALFKSAFVSAVSELLDVSQETMNSFEAMHIHSGRQLAGTTLEKLNRVLAKLLEMVQQLMNQQQQASMEGFFDQLEKLMEQQQKINDQAERLKQEPSSNPMLQEMLKRMAAEQSMVREAMEELAQKYKEAKEVMGDMEGVAREMKEVEDALKKFDNSDKTRQSQKHILYRMLEADKSLHQQGESRKRVAKFAKDYAPPQVDPVEKELTEVRQKLFQNVSRESYPVERRDLVEKYLKSIAQ